VPGGTGENLRKTPGNHPMGRGSVKNIMRIRQQDGLENFFDRAKRPVDSREGLYPLEFVASVT